MDSKWLVAQLEKHDEKLDNIQKDVSKINVIMATNTASLEYHVKRTDLLQIQVNSIPQKALIIISIIGGIVTIASKLNFI